jgi:hypothetical protein
MLTYSEHVWKSWLNPTSNLNRYRLFDYQRLFEAYFTNVNIIACRRDLVAFDQTRQRIRAEFLSGDPQVDAVTEIKIIAGCPRESAYR